MNEVNGTKIDFSAEELKTIPKLNLKSFFELVEHLAKDMEVKTGIDYRVPIAHASNESAQGNSGLCRNYCNLFGITATPSWKANNGAICYLPTWEHIKTYDLDKFKKYHYDIIKKEEYADEKRTLYTLKVEMKREFRAYKNWKESFEDWAKLISNLSVYQGAYKLLKVKETVKEGILAYMKVWATDIHGGQTVLKIYESLIV